MFPEITVSGLPYERGRQYGAAAAALIGHSIASYSRLFAVRRGMDWAESGQAALEYLPLLERVAPSLVAEMRGIADGAGRGFAEIVALNVRTELMAGIGSGVVHPGAAAASERNRAARVPFHREDPAITPPGTPIDDGECTTAGGTGPATADGQALLAQTWDWQGDQRAACLLLRTSGPDIPTLLTMTEAGIVAKIGVNQHGVAVGLNLLRSLNDGQSIGMPVHVLLRLMLERRDFKAAFACSELAPAAGSSCVTLAGPDGELVSLELTPQGVGAIWAADGRLAHSNHCVDAAAGAQECPIDPAATTTVDRLNRARAMVEAAPLVDVALLKQVLTDHHGDPRCICRHPDMRLAAVDRGESVCAVVIETASRTLHLAGGIPCETPFRAVTVA
jgi:isopenicillin-N N-acyltransferase-like protein